MRPTSVIPNGDGSYNLVDSTGTVLMHSESWQVCANVQDALAHPEHWEPTEAYEIAEAISR